MKRSRYTTCTVAFILAGLAHTGLAQASEEVLSGTQPLTITEPLDEIMVDGISRYALRAIAQSVEQREKHWARDYSNPDAYAKSVEPNRQRFRTIIGAVDKRLPASGFEIVAKLGHDGVVARSDKFVVYAVRWPVLDGVWGEGLLLQPMAPAVARVVALPDADWTPEMLTGITSASDSCPPIAAKLAACGVQVVVPTLVSRDDTFSGNANVAFTNQPHREFIYRQAFELGRHIVGYEVEKVQSAVDELEALNQAESKELPIGIVGVSEGGLLALYSAAVDLRIDAAMVSGYFQPRERVWQEPIYRNVWSLLTEFGDAEIASLVAPRALVIEACHVPEIAGPPPVRNGRRGGAAPGQIKNCELPDVRSEFDRAKQHYEKLKAADRVSLIVNNDPGSDLGLRSFLQGLRIEQEALVEPGEVTLSDQQVDATPRQQRQVQELTDYTQRLLRRSATVRDEFWSKANTASVDEWASSTALYRNHVWEELIGKLPQPTMPPNVRTRRVIDEPAYTGYEVVIDVYPDVIAAGILLLPNDRRLVESRPVVVCQHGLEGVPMDTISRSDEAYPYYKSFAAELAKRGFIVYAPQNPYRGGDRFRVIQRQSNPMKASIFSYIIRQHERTLEWLATLPNVDPQRIGFYGLSYGGKTAMRVPTILSDKYAACICSGDFNEWVRKNSTVDSGLSYMFTGEYEMFEWNLGHVANYAELAGLMAPRPFMVERGHNDGVAPDEWVAEEYAKVRRLYDKLELSDRTEIEFFNGPHTINGVGTYRFLHRHLNWPESAASHAR
jgi:dienelactone hydrolase